jgi:prepilin-type N-terminal cleavage/methylation domain-containing protein
VGYGRWFVPTQTVSRPPRPSRKALHHSGFAVHAAEETRFISGSGGTSIAETGSDGRSGNPLSGGEETTMTRSRGFTLIELMIVVSIIGVLALIAIPNYQNMRSKAHDASATSAGRVAKLAEELYYQEHHNDGFTYTSHLAHLTQIDRNLDDDAGVTFVWSYAGVSNFTFTTSHQRGTRTFIYTD